MDVIPRGEEARKAFHFDLDENLLKVHYPSAAPTAYKRAWSQIKGFMEDNGFRHAQYSGYESVEPMSYARALRTIRDLSRAYPWFELCAQAATVTEIHEQYDALAYLSQFKERPDAPLRDDAGRDQEVGVSLREAAQGARDASRALDQGRDPGLGVSLDR